MVENIRTKMALAAATVTVLMLGGIALAGGASATPTDPVSDAFDTLQGKVTLYGGALVTLAVAAIVVLFGIKWLRKGRSAA